MQIPIVNNKDEIIGYKERKEIKSSDIYRVSALWIQNSNGDILLTQRKFTKKNDPGKRQPAVAGTVEKGENYDINIKKEAQEEIGISGYNFKKGDKIMYSGENNFFCQWYFLVVDININYFKIDKNEVEQIKWFNKNELLELVKQNPDDFLDSVRDGIKMFG